MILVRIGGLHLDHLMLFKDHFAEGLNVGGLRRAILGQPGHPHGELADLFQGSFLFQVELFLLLAVIE